MEIDLHCFLRMPPKMKQEPPLKQRSQEIGRKIKDGPAPISDKPISIEKQYLEEEEEK